MGFTGRVRNKVVDLRIEQRLAELEDIFRTSLEALPEPRPAGNELLARIERGRQSAVDAIFGYLESGGTASPYLFDPIQRRRLDERKELETAAPDFGKALRRNVSLHNDLRRIAAEAVANVMRDAPVQTRARLDLSLPPDVSETVAGHLRLGSVRPRNEAPYVVAKAKVEALAVIRDSSKRGATDFQTCLLAAEAIASEYRADRIRHVMAEAIARIPETEREHRCERLRMMREIAELPSGTRPAGKLAAIDEEMLTGIEARLRTAMADTGFRDVRPRRSEGLAPLPEANPEPSAAIAP